MLLKNLKGNQVIQKKRLLIRQKKILSLLVILFAIFCLSLGTVTATGKVDTKTTITIHDDFTYDLLITNTWDKNIFDEYGTLAKHQLYPRFLDNTYKAYLGKLEDISFSDENGEIPIVDQNYSYYADLESRTGEASGNTYTYSISGKGPSLAKYNRWVVRVDMGIDSKYYPKLIDTNEEVIINYPDKLSLYEVNQDGLISKKEEKGRLILKYINNGDYTVDVNFFDNTNQSVIKRRVGSNNFLIENNTNFIEPFEEAMEHRDLITNYQDNGLNIIITPSKVNRTENIEAIGLFIGNRIVLIEEDYLNNVTTKDSITSTILHELTHLSVVESSKSYNNYLGPWAVEGIAVYTETKYYDTFFPNNKGLNPFTQYYETKPLKKTIVEWYEKHNADFKNKTQKEFFAGYPIYGFIVNHYAKTYGEEAFLTAIKESADEITKNVTDADHIFIRHLISASGKDITSEDIFFPERSLFLSNREEFLKEMQGLIQQPVSAETFINETNISMMTNTTTPKKNEKSWTFIIVFMILSIVFWSGTLWQGMKVKRELFGETPKKIPKKGENDLAKKNKTLPPSGIKLVIRTAVVLMLFGLAFLFSIIFLIAMINPSSSPLPTSNTLCVSQATTNYTVLSCKSDEPCRLLIPWWWFNGNLTNAEGGFYQAVLNKTVFCDETCKSREYRYPNETAPCNKEESQENLTYYP